MVQSIIALPCERLGCATLSAPSIYLAKGEGWAETSSCRLEFSWSQEKREKINSVLQRVSKDCGAGEQEIFFEQDHHPSQLLSSRFEPWKTHRRHQSGKTHRSHKRRVKSTSDEGPVVCYRSWTRCLQLRLSKQNFVL